MSFPQYLLNRLLFGEFIAQFIQVADFLHGRLFDVFNTGTAETPVIRERPDSSEALHEEAIKARSAGELSSIRRVNK